MNITFTEDDGTELRWEKFRPGRMPTVEAELIETVTGMTFPEWGSALMNGSTVAGRALVWVLKKRNDPKLRFRDVAYPVEALLIGLDEDEKAKVRERLETDDTLTDEERAQVRLALGESDLEALDFTPEEDSRPPAPAPVESGTG